MTLVEALMVIKVPQCCVLISPFMADDTADLEIVKKKEPAVNQWKIKSYRVRLVTQTLNPGAQTRNKIDKRYWRASSQVYTRKQNSLRTTDEEHHVIITGTFEDLTSVFYRWKILIYLWNNQQTMMKIFGLCWHPSGVRVKMSKVQAEFLRNSILQRTHWISLGHDSTARCVCHE